MRTLLADLPSGHRSLRRERRVPHLRLRRPDVPRGDSDRGRRDCLPRRIRLLRLGSPHPMRPRGRRRNRPGFLHEPGTARSSPRPSRKWERPHRQPDRQRHRDRLRAGRARPAGRPQPRMRLPARRVGAAGADGAEIQGRGHQRRDRRARARHRSRWAVGLSRRWRCVAGTGARCHRHPGPLRGVRSQPRRRGGGDLHVDGTAGRDRFAEARFDGRRLCRHRARGAARWGPSRQATG